MIILLIVIFVYLLIFLSKNVSLSKKGQLFEKRIYLKLSIKFRDSRILTNLYIPFHDKYTEIDILLINKKGIYVIEAKNFSGWIFANLNSKYWMEIHYKKINQFYKPIKQNKSHIDGLRKIINENVTYYNIVVFSNKCQFKELLLSKYENVDVIQENELISIIKNKPLTNNFINEEMIQKIYNNLLKYANPSKEIVYEHNKYVISKKMKM